MNEIFTFEFLALLRVALVLVWMVLQSRLPVSTLVDW